MIKLYYTHPEHKTDEVVTYEDQCNYMEFKHWLKGMNLTMADVDYIEGDFE